MPERDSVQARVLHRDDVAPRPIDARTVATLRVLISAESGARQVRQQLLQLPPGTSAPIGHGGADDVLYVIEGEGMLRSEVRPEIHDLTPGTAALIPPKVPAKLENTSDEEHLVAVSVLSPPPFEGVFTLEARVLPLVVIHEDDQPSEPAGDDREFRVLIDPRHGTRNVTQFVGFIDRSRAPFHTHTYEEAIYILEGQGILHVAGNEPFDAPIQTGSGIFLPPNTPHCLENASPGVLKLLGVFSPPGSPGPRGRG